MTEKTPNPHPNGKVKDKKIWLRGLLLIIGVFLVIFTAGYWIANEALPAGTPGADAEALAREMLAAVQVDSWERTGAVRWDYAGRHSHLWDRKRQLARVRWENLEVLVDLNSRRGVAFRDGTMLGGDAAAEAVYQAWEYWCNDAFWLNPVAKLYDPGVTRAYVDTADSLRGLLVTYQSGGVTPGDSYLWLVDHSGLPVRWKMWVSVLPIGGVSMTWEEWLTLSTGARVATLHRNGPFEFRLSGVQGADSLGALTGGTDPFQPLVSYLRQE